MKTINISMTFTPDQLAGLQQYVRNTKVAIPGDQPGDTIHRQTYSSVEALLKDQFYTSIRHLLPHEPDSNAAQLKREADEAARKAREAELQMFTITEQE